MKILWIAPNLNHYKARFLDRLVEMTGWEMVVLAGARMTADGHRHDGSEKRFQQVLLGATKKNFYARREVYATLWRLLREGKFQVVLMPLEKKHLPVIFYLFLLKFLRGYRLVSYNHPTVKFENRRPSLEKIVTKVFFLLYDRIIFYTEHGRDWAVEQKLLPPAKAFFANNTLDTDLIRKHYSFSINTSTHETLLFIGRLIPAKQLDVLFEYYEALKRILPDLQLIIIGDGPLRKQVEEKAGEDKDIVWRGAVVDEALIAADMEKAHFVFHPGASGLTVVHAFCYGKPYVTMRDCELHGPEMSYLIHRENGLLLSGDINSDVHELVEVFCDHQIYREMCRNAYLAESKLSVSNWCQQMQSAICAVTSK